jgi:hypothetical protein
VGFGRDCGLRARSDAQVTAELACRLLESRALLRTEVATALQDASARGISLVESLADRIPGALGILETEFSRWSGPLTTSAPVDVPLMQRLPAGICERLLAVPLAERDPLDRVRLAVVDPYDSHVLSEFAFCLSVAVTPVRIAYTTFAGLLVAWRNANGVADVNVLLDVPDDATPAFGTRALRMGRKPPRPRPGLSSDLGGCAGRMVRRGFSLPPLEVPASESEQPIPLVRTTMPPVPASLHPVRLIRTTKPLEPADEQPLALVHTITAAPGRSDHSSVEPAAQSPASSRRDSEPVLQLLKQKPAPSIRRISLPAPPRFAQYSVERPEALLALLDEAKTPRRLIELLREALGRMAPCQAYFSLRAGRHVLEWASGAESMGQAVLTPDQETLLGNACQAGYYLGPLPPDGANRALGAMLGLRAREEIYVTPINVTNRPALVVVVGRFDEPFAVTRWVDSVAARASQVLERLIRQKK